MVDKTKVLYLTNTLKKLPDKEDDDDDQSIYIEGYASTNSPDRVGDVIPASVWEKGLKNYLKNPIILAHHKHSDPAGRMVEHKVDGMGLWIKARISAGASIYKLVKDEVMTAFSVGIRILDAEYNAAAEVARLLNTTVSAINNKLAELEISNSASRLVKLKLLKQLQIQGRVLISEFDSSRTLVSVKCSKGHLVTQQASNIIHHNTGCPKCFQAEGSSKGENDLLNFIKSVYPEWIELKDRSILGGKELDIVLPDIGIAIEYNGTYWHSDDKVGKTYHKDKADATERFGFQLIQIKDYDWVTKPEIVKSMLKSKLGIITTKIPARKCAVKRINFPKDFLETNHIQGSGQPTSENYGLFYNNTLVAVATFAPPRYDPRADLELVRYCTLLNTTVVGGLSRLLKQPNYSLLVTYASRDYSTGAAYKATGFHFSHYTAPGLEYYNRLEKLSRYKAQSMTEEELSKYVKYYNSGNMVFMKACK